jgi:two-component system chemotaxis sensor kinase CheA
MALAGELVLTRNALVQSLDSGNLETIAGAAQRVDSLTSELQDGIMLTRMQPIGSTFARFRRMIRDLALQLGKRIELSIEGEDVEVDKSVIEAIGDPLVHLVRNAADHGIETAVARMAAGKPETGHLFLRASHAAGQVWIDIEDDGAGIDPARIRAKALEKGIKSPAELAAMCYKDITMLIFAPGFSTAATVTDVSGRGVGLDVVQTGLAKIGGTIEIESRPGNGTRFRIRLPLTLAIIPSLLVRAGDERYALPQANILELARIPGREMGHRLPRIGEAAVLRLREEILPLVDLDAVLGLPARPLAGSGEGVGEAEHVAIVAAGDLKYGLRVDAFLDSMEIVVKPFGKHLAKCHHYAGATILGDGQVALILDVVGIGKFLGMDHPSPQAESEPDAGAPRREDAGPACGDYLLIETGPGRRYALPLDRVNRIDRIPGARIARVGNVLAYAHAGGDLILIPPDDDPEGNRARTGRFAQAVVFQARGREFGLLAADISDIVQADRDADAERFAQPGYLGAIRAEGMLILVPDLEHLASGWECIGTEKDLGRSKRRKRRPRRSGSRPNGKSIGARWSRARRPAKAEREKAEANRPWHTRWKSSWRSAGASSTRPSIPRGMIPAAASWKPWPACRPASRPPWPSSGTPRRGSTGAPWR